MWHDVRLKRADDRRRAPDSCLHPRHHGKPNAPSEALRASEEQYRAIFNASADALVLWNSRSQRVDVDPTYERMYGYTRDEVLGGVRAHELPEELRKRQEAIIARTLAGERCHGRSKPTGGTANAFLSRCARSRFSIEASRTCLR